MEKESKITVITAEEAKQIADSSRSTINRIYKAIKEEAKNNSHMINGWDLTSVGLETANKIKDELFSKGFVVDLVVNKDSEYNLDVISLFINWLN